MICVLVVVLHEAGIQERREEKEGNERWDGKLKVRKKLREKERNMIEREWKPKRINKGR